jgi:hypothetical protein
LDPDPHYDQYLAWKEQIQNQYNMEYSLQASLLPQMGGPEGRLAGDRCRKPEPVAGQGLHIAPDIQLYFDPALMPASGPVAVFTLRATATLDACRGNGRAEQRAHSALPVP